MKKFKIIMSCLCVAALMFSFATTSFAATLDQNNPTGDTITYYKAGQVSDPKDEDNPIDDEMEGTYLITIPEYIEAAEVGGVPTTQDVTAEECLLLYNSTLNVAVEFSGEFTLRDNADTKLAYKMQADGTDITTGDTVLSVSAGDPVSVTSVAIGAALTADPLYAGVYTDTATFTASVEMA